MNTTTALPASLKPVPGPPSSFFTGSMREMRQDQLGLMLHLRERYGDVVRFRAFGPIFLYLCFDPHGIDHILRINPQNYHKGRSLQRLTPLLGHENLLLTEDDAWLRQRRLAQPAFHRQRIANLAAMMTTYASSMVQRWQRYEQSQQAFDLSAEIDVPDVAHCHSSAVSDRCRIRSKRRRPGIDHHA